MADIRFRPLWPGLLAGALLITGAAGLAVCRPAAVGAEQVATAAIEQQIRSAMANPVRTEQQRARDTYRHPLETLTFFGLRPEMTVVELWPGGGWYTTILAPVVAERGKLVVSTFDANGPKESGMTRSARALNERLASDPKTYGKVQTVLVAPPDNLTLGPDNSADLVLTFRNIHNWAAAGYEDKVYAAAFKVLKKGGTFGVEEHRARPGVSVAESIKTGYMPEDYVIKKIEAAGFKLTSKSEINANPRDTRDHVGGVWTLPPTLSQGEKDREKYLAIGESDRMTLKFTKP
ncbi:MAG: methyltransferase [Aphanocapsa lilacina HA4352-LM1]|jgi:predicted methyltransferase|nr:methyltransferase [Aphanocapsa lilacina HA4352-LM1]